MNLLANPLTLLGFGGKEKELGPRGVGPVQNLLAPDYLKVEYDHVQSGDDFISVVALGDLPPNISTGWAQKLFVPTHPMRIVLRVEPQDRGKSARKLKARMANLEANRRQSIKRGEMYDADREIAYEQSEILYNRISQANERIHDTTFLLGLRSDSADQVRQDARHLETQLGLLQAVSHRAILQGQRAFESLLPSGRDTMALKPIPLDCASLAKTFPFGHLSFNDPNGAHFGWNMLNNTPVCIDTFSAKFDNMNSCIVAKSGAGKSFTATLIEVLRSLPRRIRGKQVQVIVIDPKNEYGDIAEALRQQAIYFAVGSPDHINPLALPEFLGAGTKGDPVKEHMAVLHGLMALLLGDISPEERGTLDGALMSICAKKGIYPGQSYAGATMPIMSELLTEFEDLAHNNIYAQSLAARMVPVARGVYSALFEGQSTIKANAPLTVFSIGDVPEEMKPSVMYMIAQYVWSISKADPSISRRLVIDEAHRLVKFDAGDQFVDDFARTARSFNVGVTCITQDPEDFVNSRAGRQMLLNSSYTILLRQKREIAVSLQKAMNLPDSQVDFLTSSGIGEALILVQHPDKQNQQVALAVRIEASPRMKALCERDVRRMSADGDAA